ncbi:MAG: hypothetical protein EI684_19420, partial [Candidatus Viridilinea halotolerans]
MAAEEQLKNRTEEQSDSGQPCAASVPPCACFSLLPHARLRITIHGAVQGVGFRPFVYRLATRAGLAGWVANGAAGVALEVEGPRAALEDFAQRLASEHPRAAVLIGLETTWLPPLGLQGFTICPSAEAGALTVQVVPDLATCPECLAELHDPQQRRWHYP